MIGRRRDAVIARHRGRFARVSERACVVGIRSELVEAPRCRNLNGGFNQFLRPVRGIVADGVGSSGDVEQTSANGLKRSCFERIESGRFAGGIREKRSFAAPKCLSDREIASNLNGFLQYSSAIQFRFLPARRDATSSSVRIAEGGG